MNQTEKLLQSIIENGRIGEDACDQLLSKTDDMELRKELMLEKQQYAETVRDAETRLCDMGIHPQPKGMPARMSMWMGMQMNTIMDRSTPHIAEILIQGATMGVVEITKARNAYPEADAEAQGIASNMITRQQDAIERLKSFLNEKAVVK
jgi:hypothetical protein